MRASNTKSKNPPCKAVWRIFTVIARERQRRFAGRVCGAKERKRRFAGRVCGAKERKRRGNLACIKRCAAVGGAIIIIIAAERKCAAAAYTSSVRYAASFPSRGSQGARGGTVIARSVSDVAI